MLQSQRVKKLSAVAGATAFVAMVLLGVGSTQNQASTGTASSEPAATLGETVTTTTPPTEPVTTKATPPFTFTTPSGFAAPH
jgi:hypothetical protein